MMKTVIINHRMKPSALIGRDCPNLLKWRGIAEAMERKKKTRP